SAGLAHDARSVRLFDSSWRHRLKRRRVEPPIVSRALALELCASLRAARSRAYARCCRAGALTNAAELTGHAREPRTGSGKRSRESTDVVTPPHALRLQRRRPRRRHGHACAGTAARPLAGQSVVCGGTVAGSL